ncbi:MAG: hypothetical protein ABUL62_34060 [Myxococcales bacterium]|jgi:hypothetical protein
MDEPEQTPEALLEQLSAPERAVRWKAARLLAHDIDIGRARGAEFRAACVPVLLDVLEAHDAYTAFDAEDAARRLVDIGERTAEVRACMGRCLNRAQDELLSLAAALTPIQNSELPERDILRARVDSYRSLVESLRGYLEEFRASPVASFAPPAAATVTAVAESRRPGKAGNISLLLPVLALLLVVGGVAALLLSHKSRSEVNLNSALPAAPSASATPEH